jgi:hypothetical protein
MSLAWKGVIGFVLIWTIAGIAIFAARSSRPTHESVLAFIQNSDIPDKSEAQADPVIVSLADQLTRMTADERRIVENSDTMRHAFRSFTVPQQRKFLDLTLPSGMKQTMEALNKMAPAQRDAFVQQALSQAKQDMGVDNGTADKKAVDKVLEQGFAAFYSTASPEVKLQMAPVLEQLHTSLQNL